MKWVGLGEFVMFFVGILVSSFAWHRCFMKIIKKYKAKERVIADRENQLLDEMVGYVEEREKVIELENHLTYKTDLLKTGLAEVKLRNEDMDNREKSLKDAEFKLHHREKSIQSKLDDMEGQLKAAREKARRIGKKGR